MNNLIRIFLIAFIGIFIWSCGNESPNVDTQKEVFGGEIIIQKYPDSSKMISVNYMKGDTTRFNKSYYYQNGQVYMSGPMINGLRDGEWSAYDEEGRLLTIGHYRNGIDHGLKTVYFENGNKRYEGSYENGEKIGKWQFYDKDGKLFKELEFDSISN